LQTDELGCHFIGHIAFSPDAKLVAAVHYNSWGCNKTPVGVWNVKTKKLIKTIDKSVRSPASLHIAHDNDTLLVGGHVAVERFSLTDKTIKNKHIYPGGLVIGAALNPIASADQIAIGVKKQYVMIAGAAANAKTTKLQGFKGHPFLLAYRPDGKRLAVASDQNELWIYDTSTWKVVKKYTKNTGTLSSLSYNKKGDTLAIGQTNSSVVLWKPDTDTIERTIKVPSTFDYRVYHAVFSKDGKYLFSAWGDRTVKIHDLTNGQQVHVIGNHRDEVRAFAVSPDDKVLLSGAGKYLRWWGCP
tara:strand:- start:22517 stop:23416 length:900 start_codon:yes stop_codon:yes gene_type:complete